MIVLTILVLVLGFVHFAVSTRSFYKVVFGKGFPSKAARNWLHLVGYGYRVLGLWLCYQFRQDHVAILIWVGLLHLAAVLVAMMLTYAPALFKQSWRFGCLGRLGQKWLA